MFQRDVVLDTAPLVAAFDARDQWHRATVALWPDLIDRCVTTEAVVSEACHLVLRATGNARAALDFVLEAGIPILGADLAGQRRAAALMRRYHAVPMDYADASLVVISEALGITTAFTTDRRGFRAYAASRGSQYTILPNP